MKKMLLEYANIIGYTVTGLIFGLAFFLLFINFYHAKDLSEKVDVSNYLATSKATVEEKINQIKSNTASYNQTTYHGSENFFAMTGIQIRLNSCIEIFESEESKEYLNKTEIGIQDAYHFNIFYQNEILNSCVVMQLNAFGSDPNAIDVSSIYNISPWIKLNIDHLLTSPSYITNNLRNADAYYVSNASNKSSIFDITRDSYTTTMTNYQAVLDLLVELSSWYKNMVVGG